MQCFCCGAELAMGRKVKIRRWRDNDPNLGGPGSAAYQSHQEQMTYRWSVICQACYSTLDNYLGLATVAGQLFNLAGASRGDKATTIDEAKYRVFQRQEARKLGIELDEDA